MIQLSPPPPQPVDSPREGFGGGHSPRMEVQEVVDEFDVRGVEAVVGDFQEEIGELEGGKRGGGGHSPPLCGDTSPPTPGVGGSAMGLGVGVGAGGGLRGYPPTPCHLPLHLVTPQSCHLPPTCHPHLVTPPPQSCHLSPSSHPLFTLSLSPPILSPTPYLVNPPSILSPHVPHSAVKATPSPPIGDAPYSGGQTDPPQPPSVTLMSPFCHLVLQLLVHDSQVLLHAGWGGAGGPGGGQEGGRGPQEEEDSRGRAIADGDVIFPMTVHRGDVTFHPLRWGQGLKAGAAGEPG